MTESSTRNDLIRYVYQEMSETESENFEKVLRNDDAYMQEYIDLLSTIDQMDQLFVEPSEKVVRAIKQTAKSPGLERV